MGANWEKLQTIRNKKFNRKNYPKNYVAVIEIIRSRYSRLIASNADTYKTWCKQNKKNRDTLLFIKTTLKILDKKK